MKIIGQKNNINFIEKCRQNNSFPRFMIITGEKGSGKKTFARYIAKEGIQGYSVFPENGVDAVREAIESSYKCSALATYIFFNTDKMSAQAKNALLKVTEEPPKKAHFIITVEDINNTLSTLKSRGVEIKMEPYSYSDLKEYLKEQNCSDEKVLEISNNPGQLKELLNLDLNAFISFCETVLDSIGVVTGVNAFKIANRFKFKDDISEGYDPILFFNCLMSICVKRVVNNETSEKKCLETIRLCSKYKREMSITGIKKDATFDMWILEMRSVWAEG